MIAREVKQALLDEIDGMLDWLLKADRWQRLARKLSNLLFQTWDDEQRDAINDAIKFLQSADEKITAEDVKRVLLDVEKRLSARVAELMRKPVAQFQSDAYAQAHKELNVKFEFNRADRDALDWLERDMVYWVGSHYDREYSDKLRALASSVVESGLSQREAAEFFRDNFADTLGDVTLPYWEGLSNHIVTRSREFGRVSAYQRAGATHYKILAVLDARTSLICREMDGRIIRVDEAVKLRDRMMRAKSPESVKRIAPWLTPEQVNVKVVGKLTEKLQNGLALPPYHFHSRLSHPN